MLKADLENPEITKALIITAADRKNKSKYNINTKYKITCNSFTFQEQDHMGM